ncbi:hypothetical protein CNECB9_3480070 [Cupriavidus necator]|uniref:Uncharacterized protein n=1 Tax=Cupriavidus necator TaxID=106590 RepID=A0A1K0JCP5_CUPNE|nr:hypothetical protein CNECB9_3480070 [Cupriavidus necator]
MWNSRLATSAKATPMTYRSSPSGGQFVMVTAGGRPHYGTKPGTKLVAYPLPAANARGARKLPPGSSGSRLASSALTLS